MRVIKLVALGLAILAAMTLVSTGAGYVLEASGAPKWVGTVATMVTAFVLAGPCLGIYAFLAGLIK